MFNRRRFLPKNVELAYLYNYEIQMSRRVSEKGAMPS
jgi:hypothetical protein